METTRATVFAAASLTDAFPKIAPGARFSFAGSNTLAAQIRQGAPADVFASANMTLPEAAAQGRLLLEAGRVHAEHARRDRAEVEPGGHPQRLRPAAQGIKLVIAAPGVPVGSYTLQVLKNMNLTSVLTNVVSRENDVREVLAKVALGEADAGFVYSTDARTVPSKVRVLKIPAWAQPKVQYGICVVSASHNKAAASAFVKRVLGPAGQKILLRYGFLPRVKR